MGLGTAFEIKSSTLHCICAVGNCQQEMAARHAVHTSIVEIVSHDWRLEESRRSFSIK